MPAPTAILRRLFLDLGVTGKDWPMYVSHLPDSSYRDLCLFDTAGVPDGRIMATGRRIEHPGVQIVVRAPEYVLGWSKAEELALLLDGQRQVSVAIAPDETYILQNASRTGTILDLGMETLGDKRRFSFSINAVLTIL